MSGLWLPSGPFLASAPGMESPPCPVFLLWLWRLLPSGQTGLGCSPWSEHYCQDKVMWVQSKLGWQGGHRYGTPVWMLKSSPKCGCWVVK